MTRGQGGWPGLGKRAFFEALFKKRGAAVPIDFGCFLLDSGKQGRKAQQRRRGAQLLFRLFPMTAPAGVAAPASHGLSMQESE